MWPPGDDPSLDTLRARVRSSYVAFIASLESSDLDRNIEYRNSAGAEFATRLDLILLHVFLHEAYHRGQIAMLARDEGRVPGTSDLIEFLRGAAAATRDDSDPGWRES